MNEIQQYRQDSAKWMGLEYVGQWKWKPDQDHNQMAMMEDKLIEEGYTISIVRDDGGTNVTIFNDTLIENQAVETCSDERKEIAFMRAWTEYYNQQP